MDLCATCNSEPRISEYRCSVCRTCKRLYDRLYYTGSIDIQRKIKGQRERREKVRRFIADYLLKNPCIDCGESDIVVLDFDHRDRNTKVDNIASMIARSLSLERIKAEIAKCEIRCANCHRRRTAKQLNSYRLAVGESGTPLALGARELEGSNPSS